MNEEIGIVVLWIVMFFVYTIVFIWGFWPEYSLDQIFFASAIFGLWSAIVVVALAMLVCWMIRKIKEKVI